MTSVELAWIPLGAGGHSVRFSGIVYEAISAGFRGRPRRVIVHSALVVSMSAATFTIEMTPVPDRSGAARGVVAQGPVGLRWLGRWRLFRYEVRCWPNGLIPDLDHAIVRVPVIGNDRMAERVIDVLSSLPTATWGRDELGAGEMWSCNSIISWALATAGADTDPMEPPTGTRAPGWGAGIEVARRAISAGGHGRAVELVQQHGLPPPSRPSSAAHTPPG